MEKIFCKNCKWFEKIKNIVDGEVTRSCTVLFQEKYFFIKTVIDKFGDENVDYYWNFDTIKIFNKEFKRVKAIERLTSKGHVLLEEKLYDCPLNNKFDCKFYEEKGKRRSK